MNVFKTRKGIIALLIALMVALLCAMPLTTVAAKADNEGAAPVEPVETKRVYYFSDYAGSAQLSQSLESAVAGADVQHIYYAPDEFCNRMLNAYVAGEFDIEDSSYVIFEIRSEFRAAIIDYNFDVYLLQFFSNLKSKDCKIMFICNTDGLIFTGYDAFLDYVDIHVNTDVFSTFFSNVIDRAGFDCGGNVRINNCTFVFDKFLSEGVNEKSKNINVLKYYLLPYIKIVYFQEISYEDISIRDVLRQQNIKVFCHIGENEYYDVVEEKPLYFTDYDSFYDYLANERIYAIGDTASGYDYSREWINFIIGLRDYSETTSIPIFEFNSKRYTFGELSKNNVYVAYGADDNDVLQIMIDFLNDEDLSVYNNRPGRCVVSYSVLEYGVGGWMFDLLRMDEDGDNIFLRCWSVPADQTDSDYLYYHDSDW